jgi:hypothetical protein
MEEQAAIVAAAIIERRIFFKTDCPSTVELAPYGRRGLNPSKSGEKVPLVITEYYNL